MRIALALALLAVTAPAAGAADPLCTGTYSGAPPRSGAPIRFGIDPGLAGSAGGVQLPTVPDDPLRDVAAVGALRPSGRVLVVRLNRLFESDGAAGIARFAAEAARYGRAGMEVEIQVRYHPTAAENGDLAAWTRYVREVVDVLGRVPGVEAMTITNEVNLAISPNTSDGYYMRAPDALIAGIEAARDEALRVRRPALRFGFTYAYRFSPSGDANFFAYLRTHGGERFLRALGFVGIDFYPGSFYPPVLLPGDTYRSVLAQAAGTVRRCLAPLAGIPPTVPLWFTEIGVPVGLRSEAGQAAALDELVRAAQAYSATFNITDLRWFNLRDSVPEGPEGLVGPLFTSDGLLRSDYSPKPAFATFRALIDELGRPNVGPTTVGAGAVTVDLDRVLSRFRPDRALGAGVDGHGAGETGQIFTRTNQRAMSAAGFGPLTYRLRTELGVEAWHWNAVGSWSDPAHRQGYWTGSPRPHGPLVATYGYRLPRRGDTIDQANDDGYSRLDDGRRGTFWKSDPYLDPHFTHEADGAHSQWLIVDLGRVRQIDAVRLAWAQPYARRVTVEQFVGRHAGIYGDLPDGYWQPVGRFRGRGGTQTFRLRPRPPALRYLRVVFDDSSHTAPPGSTDIRDRLGFAVREVYAGTLAGRALRDVIRHRSDHRQSVTYVSSTDPWHRARDRDPNVEQPSFGTVGGSGLLHRMPLLAPVPTLYGTPADAVNEVRYLGALRIPVHRMELGEEPDGQLVTPEDYGTLYAQFAARLHRSFPHLALGGPGYQTSIPDWRSWPLRRGGDTSWTRRFLHELRRRHASRALAFFSFEWYPFDNGCAAPASQLAAAPGLLTRVLAAQRAEGLPPGLPKLITEYGYSAFATRDMVDLPGALLNADIVGAFLADGGSAAYLYGLEPDTLINELGCSWGNLILYLANDVHRIIQPMATLYGAQMLTREWAEPGDRVHAMLAASTTAQNAAGQPLVTAYALRRPDGQLALLLVNKDPTRAWMLDLRLRRRSTSPLAGGRATVMTLSPAQYVWHPRGERGYARPDGPPFSTSQPASLPLTVPASSLTVVRLRP